MKAINFETLPIVRISKKASLKLVYSGNKRYSDSCPSKDQAIEWGENDFSPATEKGLSREKSNFMVIPLVDEQIETGTVPVEIQEVMNEYVDVMPQELPKSLPPQRRIDHKIELVPGTKTPAKNAYRMAPLS
ncbi:reverse transcriptase [Cucumis melo var. makuwa]|uniref:Reverse transcriptase n=1 Tax=Cucumis melo var. makuwa TaxID=1194695 RepID=A0A5A7STK8_CUCMM|nr:reverse transcriptase [Cucumis melo var. makuwa]TYK02576.1 reverse transcriptase [Cucumis melo var. makuwa]